MAAILEATLMDLMLCEDLDTLDERTDWMMLTWDMVRLPQAAGENTQCVRFFLSLDGTVITHGDHEASAYSITNPLLGAPVSHVTSGDFPLREASSVTENIQHQGYEVLCRPLAVDCSELKGRPAARNRTVTSTGDLLRGINSGSGTGLDAVRAVNITRARALSTHLNSQWLEKIVPAAAYDLWNAVR